MKFASEFYPAGAFRTLVNEPNDPSPCNGHQRSFVFPRLVSNQMGIMRTRVLEP